MKKIIWQDEITNIKFMIAEGNTLAEIGDNYGVSRQRIYQVFTKFGLHTLERKRKNLLRDLEPKYYWLNNALARRGFNKSDRLRLLEEFDLPDVCPVLGLELNYGGTGGTNFTRKDNSPSIDRIDSKVGYIEGNMAVISWKANRIKSNGTADEHTKIATWMRSMEDREN